MQQTTPSPVPLSSGRAAWLLAIAMGLSAALVGLFIRGGSGLGLTLAITAATLGLWIYHIDPSRVKTSVLTPHVRFHSKTRQRFLIVLTAVILLLGSAYTLTANPILHALNFPVIVNLLIILALLLFGSSDHDWDEPLFWLEILLSGPTRPFVRIPALSLTVKRLLHPGSSPAEEAEPASTGHPKAKNPPVGPILLGLLLAVPVLLIAGALLSSADAVFGQIWTGFVDYWTHLSIRERLADIALTLLFFPFIFSFLESHRSRWQLFALPKSSPVYPTSIPRPIPGILGLKFNPYTLFSFLVSINVMYLLFSVIQITYLTGAFRLILPDGLTYAEYARNGFFELAGMTTLNVALIILAVKGVDRPGRVGRIGKLLRSQSLLLVAGSLVQWSSALFRMHLYISAYGLTLMRFFVTAFILLMAVWFVLLTIKEFKPGFRLFKSAAVAAVLALVLLNAVQPDARVAQFNLRQNIAQPTRMLDLDYFEELSPDAVPVLLKSLTKLSPEHQAAARQYLDHQYVQLSERTAGETWQDINWSERHALQTLIDWRVNAG